MFRGLLLVLAATTSLAAPSPAQVRIAASWQLVDGSTHTDRPGTLSLDRARVQAAGWQVRDGARDVSGDQAVLDGNLLRVELSAPSLVVVPMRPGSCRAWLDERFELQLLETISEKKDTGVLLLPPGEHRIQFEPLDLEAGAVRWWAVVLVPLLLPALILAMGHRRLNAGAGDMHGTMSMQGALRPAVALVLVTIGTWAWTLDLPLVAIDHELAVVTPLYLEGHPLRAPELNTEEPARFLADGDVFRPVQFTILGALVALRGPDPVALHLLGVIAHVGVVLGLFLVLLRVTPRGAFAGGLVAATLPITAPAIAWVNAQALLYSLAGALLALPAAAAYLDRGRFRNLSLVPALLWLAVGSKESGMPHLVLVPMAALALARNRPWRRVVLLGSAVVLVLVSWFAGRHIHDVHGGLQTYGMSFASPVDMATAAARNLPAIARDAVSPGLTWDVDETTIRAASDSQPRKHEAARVALSVARFHLPDLAWQTLCGLLILMAAMVGGRKGLALLGGTAVWCVLATLPDALHHVSGLSHLRKALPLAVPAAAIVVAVCVHGARERGRPWQRAANGLVVLLIVAGVPVHLRHYANWRILGGVVGGWLNQTDQILQRVEIPEGDPLRGPPAVVIIGRPPSTEIGPVIGPSLTAFLKPPFSERTWAGDHVPNEQAAARASVSRWPWDLVVLQAPGGFGAPVHAHTLPAFSGQVPGPATVEPQPGSENTWLVTPAAPLREVGAVEFTFPDPLPPGTIIEIPNAPPLVVSRGRAAQRPLLLELVGCHQLRLIPDAPLQVTVHPPEGPPVRPPSVRVLREIPPVSWVAPAPGSPIPPGCLPPELHFDDLPGREGFRLTVIGDGPGFEAHVPKTTVRLRDAALTRLDGGRVATPLLAEAAPEHWQQIIDGVRKARPDVDAFWIRVRVEGVVGFPSWVQTRSPWLPLKVELR